MTEQIYAQALLMAGELTVEQENLLQNASFVLAFVLFAWCIIRLTGSRYNPFIYFRF